MALTKETLGDPSVNVQPNVVTKTGPIADELRKMRTLLAKLTEHLNNGNLILKPRDEFDENVDPPKWDELSRVLDIVNRDGVVDES